VTYCETVTVREKVVDAIRTVDWPGSPFELAVVEYDKCIGCGICVAACPWDAITMYSYEEGLKVAPDVTLVYHEEPKQEATAVAPSVTEEASLGS
jgi:Fe-S-cluster-containing hydrogenase component 2